QINQRIFSDKYQDTLSVTLSNICGSSFFATRFNYSKISKMPEYGIIGIDREPQLSYSLSAKTKDLFTVRYYLKYLV
ncbi:MAG: hypothetical protein HQK67_10740, partial [Desulfamplus sp.]|nr:hypothetical protein [Desulfamplus sp.]